MTLSIESEPVWCKEYSNDTNVVWYFSNIDNKLTGDTRHLLETYSNIPKDEVLRHINTIREKAWAIRSHMCTGQGMFLNPTMPRHPLYHSILSRLNDGASLVDVGTFIGQDLRKLVFDGAPSTNLYGVDIVNHWETGFEMYQDREKFHAQYIECDILDPNLALAKLNGKMDVIWITHLLHQWTWEGQVLAAKNLVSLSRVGTIVVGYQVGAGPAKFQGKTELMKADSWLHDPESFSKMWEEVGEKTESKWKTTAEFKTIKEMGWEPEDMPESTGRKILEFTVERVE